MELDAGTVIILIGLGAAAVAVVGIIILTVIAIPSAFVYRAPGGMLTLTGCTVMVGMFVFAQFMTYGMDSQFGYAGSAFEFAAYAYGAFLCVLGYARLSWHWFRTNRRRDTPADT